MKNTKRIPRYATRIVCTDGSTFNIDYPFSKNDVFLVTDLNNNPTYLSPFKQSDLQDSRFKTKQKSLQFDFMKLLTHKEDKK